MRWGLLFVFLMAPLGGGLPGSIEGYGWFFVFVAGLVGEEEIAGIIVGGVAVCVVDEACWPPWPLPKFLRHRLFQFRHQQNSKPAPQIRRFRKGPRPVHRPRGVRGSAGCGWLVVMSDP